MQWDRTGAYVWKIAAGSAHRVAVQILGRRSGTVIVTGDLAENDPVVVEGLQRLREGSKVTEDGAGPNGSGQGKAESTSPEAAAGSVGQGGGGGGGNGAGQGGRPRRPPSG